MGLFFWKKSYNILFFILKKSDTKKIQKKSCFGTFVCNNLILNKLNQFKKSSKSSKVPKFKQKNTVQISSNNKYLVKC